MMSFSTPVSTSEALKLTLYAVAAIVVTRQAYKALPDWAKPIKRDEDYEPDANDDIANPFTILSKMRGVMQLCRDEVDDELPWFKVHACFLAFLHLQHELEAAYPERKSQRYLTEGKPYKDIEELKEILHYCQMAKWAYLKSYLELHADLKQAGYALLRHDTATEPGRVGHFVAVQHVQKLAVIAIKGTSTLSDVLTDVLGQAVDHTLDAPLGDIKTVRVHEGMYAAAQMLLDDTQHLVEKFFLPQGYKVVVTGHSLGAGVACLLGLFLHTRIKGLTPEKLRVLAFATPPCLDLTVCQAMAPFCTTLVNNTDCIPRASVQNLDNLNHLFKKVNDKLVAQGRAPTNWKTTKAFLADITKVDNVTLMTPDELLEHEAQILKSRTAGENALFVPGRTIVLWESNGKFQSVVGDGSLLVLRHFEVATTMISDHPCLKYKENLGILLEQLRETK